MTRNIPKIKLTATSTSAHSTVLVVEDNVDLAEMISAFLRDYGLEVLTATSPSEALSLVPSRHPKVFVLDIGLPEMDGYQLGHELKLLCPEAVFIGHSAWAKNEKRQMETQFAFDHYFTKPSHLLDLANYVRSAAQ